ncbi:MAG: MBL fold metallo-hydrolase [Anaerolineae bacterium]|jgi:L-ascorbate metabolism protein UlaG (beta-lactamase superfamily)
MLKGIQWLGHASFRITGDDTVIYLDPWKLKGKPPTADLILVSHDHHDHLSPEDIARITGENTVIVCPAVCADQVSGDVCIVAAGDSLQVGNIAIEVVPAYNTNKPNHPKEAGHVGYVVTVEGRRIYHAGDTDLIPEMDDIRCDVALLPMGGRYTMDATEAAEALARLRPQVAVPMHWGGIVGTVDDVEVFKSSAPEGVQVVPLEVEE